MVDGQIVTGEHEEFYQDKVRSGWFKEKIIKVPYTDKYIKNKIFDSTFITDYNEESYNTIYIKKIKIVREK